MAEGQEALLRAQMVGNLKLDQLLNLSYQDIEDPAEETPALLPPGSRTGLYQGRSGPGAVSSSPCGKPRIGKGSSRNVVG